MQTLRFAAILALLLTLALPVAAFAQDGGEVTLQSQTPAVGTVFVVTTNNSSELKLAVEMNGMVLQNVDQTSSGVEKSRIEVLEVADGKVQKVKVQPLEIKSQMIQNGVPNLQEGAQVGKTYFVTRGEDDKLQATNEDGSEAAAEDAEQVIDMVDVLFEGDPVMQALPQRALKIGESFNIPDEAANKNAEQGMTVSNVVWKLVGVEEVKGRKAAVFEVSQMINGEPQPGLKIAIEQKGQIKVCVMTSTPLTGATTGPMKVTGGQQTPQGNIDFNGTGKVNYSIDVDIEKTGAEGTGE